MSSTKVKLGLFNSLILLIIAIWIFQSTSYTFLAIILLGSAVISTDVAGTLFDEQTKLKILRDD